jgi:hypothetical protein
MKRTYRLQIATLIFISLAALLALNACSGVLGGQNVVRVYVPELAGEGAARHVSTDPDVTNGYVVVLKKDKIYSLNNFSDDAFNYLKGGKVYITNLPEGDYIFGVALLTDSDKNYGLAIKEVAIQPGFNDVPIVLGPGITDFDITGGPSIDNPLVPSDDYSVEFAEDTVIIDYGRTGGADVDVTFDFGDGTSLSPTIYTDIGVGQIGAPDTDAPYSVRHKIIGSGLSVDIGGLYSYNFILK